MVRRSYLGFLIAVYSDRLVKMIGAVSSIAFAVAYAFTIGMAFRSSIPIPPGITYRA